MLSEAKHPWVTSARTRPRAPRTFRLAAALGGDFSALDGPGCQAKGVTRIVNDPTTGLPLPNNQISPARFDAASVALSKYLPQTADPCGKVSYGIPVQSNDTQLIGRVSIGSSAPSTRCTGVIFPTPTSSRRSSIRTISW